MIFFWALYRLRCCVPLAFKLYPLFLFRPHIRRTRKRKDKGQRSDVCVLGSFVLSLRPLDRPDLCAGRNRDPPAPSRHFNSAELSDPSGRGHCEWFFYCLWPLVFSTFGNDAEYLGFYNLFEAYKRSSSMSFVVGCCFFPPSSSPPDPDFRCPDRTALFGVCCLSTSLPSPLPSSDLLTIPLPFTAASLCST